MISGHTLLWIIDKHMINPNDGLHDNLTDINKLSYLQVKTETMTRGH